MASIEKRKMNQAIHYRVFVRMKGFPSKSATFLTRAEARAWADELESNQRR